MQTRSGPDNEIEGLEPWGALDVAIAGSTHIGRVRQANQDIFDRFVDPDRDEILLVVADGMGGHRGGETASRMAVGTLGKLCIEGEGEPEARLRAAIERANQEIYKLAGKDYTLKGMGTTVVALLMRRDGPWLVAHVGDSRLYRLRDEQLEALTEDHSVVTLLLRNGSITPEEAHDHPKRNQIMRSVGTDDEVEIDIAEVEVESGDAFLLCSDGVCGLLRDPEIEAVLNRANDPHTAVAWLIDAANQAGGMDNITAMVVLVLARV